MSEVRENAVEVDRELTRRAHDEQRKRRISALLRTAGLAVVVAIVLVAGVALLRASQAPTELTPAETATAFLAAQEQAFRTRDASHVSPYATPA